MSTPVTPPDPRLEAWERLEDRLREAGVLDANASPNDTVDLLASMALTGAEGMLLAALDRCAILEDRVKSLVGLMSEKVAVLDQHQTPFPEHLKQILMDLFPLLLDLQSFFNATRMLTSKYDTDRVNYGGWYREMLQQGSYKRSTDSPIKYLLPYLLGTRPPAPVDSYQGYYEDDHINLKYPSASLTTDEISVLRQALMNAPRHGGNLCLN